jgi:hypothetical protein
MMALACESAHQRSLLGSSTGQHVTLTPSIPEAPSATCWASFAVWPRSLWKATVTAAFSLGLVGSWVLTVTF